MVTEKGYIIDRREMLRIKLKSLVAEVRIIQQEEKRMPKALATEMRLHRRTVIRNASRHAHLALGFLRGRSYDQLEKVHYTDPDWKKVEQMVLRYGAMQSFSSDAEVIAALIKHWRENPAWKAPCLRGIRDEYVAEYTSKAKTGSFSLFRKDKRQVTLMMIAESRMAA